MEEKRFKNNEILPRGRHCVVRKKPRFDRGDEHVLGPDSVQLGRPKKE